jgi:hypothetical protein
MSTLDPTAVLEKKQRLALALELVDACRRQRTAALSVTFDATPRPPPSSRRATPPLGEEPPNDLLPLTRHLSGVFTWLEKAGQKSPVKIRCFDPKLRYSPRRFQISLSLGAPVIVRPHFFPGPAYDVSSLATGIFGRVVRPDTKPMRWGRVEARIPNANPALRRLVGRGMTDARGEFLVLLQADTSTLGPLVDPVAIDVRVFGPPVAPTPPSPEIPALDPYWDVPLETIPAAATATDPVVTGATHPTGFVSTATSTLSVSCPLGRLVRAPQIQF